MKVIPTILITLFFLMAFSSLSSAQTVFTDADAANSLISNPTNWSNGLPTNGVAGTISTNATIGSTNLDGYKITHTDGTVSPAGTTAFDVGTGSYTMNGSGASVSGGFRALNVSATGELILQNGTITTAGNADSDVSGSLTVHGGTLNVGRRLSPRGGGGTITFNDGTISGTGELGGSNLDKGDIFLNGGDIDFVSVSVGTDEIDLFFGGNNSGNLTIENFFGFRHRPNNIDIDFATGTLMSMTLTNPVESGGSGDGQIGWYNVGDETGLDWAPALWADGRLTYNEQDYTVLGDWATVTSTGFGDGAKFDFDGSTLSLAGGGTVSKLAVTLNMPESTLTFLTDSNASYSIEFTTSLTNGFSALTNFPGDGFTNTVPVDTGSTNGFFKVTASGSP